MSIYGAQAALNRNSVYSASNVSLSSPGIPSSAINPNASRFSVSSSVGSGSLVAGGVRPLSTQTMGGTTAISTKTRTAIFDRNLNRTKNNQVSLSAWSFLFSEMIQYTQKRVNGIGDLERRCVDVSCSSQLFERFPWRFCR